MSSVQRRYFMYVSLVFKLFLLSCGPVDILALGLLGFELELFNNVVDPLDIIFLAPIFD